MALLGNLTGSSQFFNPGNFYNGVATQSLRFNDETAHKLTKDFSGSSPDNDKKMTISVWAKRGNVTTGSTQVILANYNAVRFLGELAWDGTDILRFDPGGDGNGSSNAYTVQTTALFRDVSSWYHIVLAYDSTQGTDTNRVKLYVNGTQQTLTAKSGHTFPPQNYAHLYSYAGANNTIGEFGAGFDSGNLDGYLSEFNFIDGLTLDPTYFGEAKNGMWIAKKYTGSYGTNGYRLQFDQVGVGTASTSTIGADTSGNNNHWTSSGIEAYDCAVLDSPENNFMTFNPLMRQSQGSNFPVTHEGNLQAQFAGFDQYKYIWSTFAIKPNTGKWYFEVEMQTNMGSTNDIAYIGLGTVGPNFSPTASNGTVGPTNFYITWRGNTGVRTLYVNDAGQSQTTVTVTNLTAGQIWQFAIDTDTGKVWLGLNNSYYAADGGTDGNPSAGTNESGTFSTNTNELSFFGQVLNYNITNVYYTLNAGQDSSFHGNKTAQGNTDANGIGDFYYAPPTGYKAICSANLPEPTIGPNSAKQADDHFNTVLWTGNGASSRSISGWGFQPDWMWSKARSAGLYHWLYDSSRGAGSGKGLGSSETFAEGGQNDATYGYLSSFDSDGFTSTSGSSSNDDHNKNNVTYVGWGWKANGGTTSSNSDGSITSTVQANTTAGFSIVTYTGNQTNGATIGHGLNKIPQMIIHKNRSVTDDWSVYTEAVGTGKKLFLNDTIAETSTSNHPTTPTNSVFYVGAGVEVNGNGNSILAYCFHSVEGYSKFGSYTGNGSTDGTFVHTGFRPAWILMKRTNSTGNWQLVDNRRVGYNPSNNLLFPDGTDAEAEVTDNDILSNGFKLRTTGAGRNGSDSTYIYMAFAEAPFKYANAR